MAIPEGDTGAPNGVSWLELFYDLVFVAAIVTFSDAVSIDPEPRVIATVFAAFAAVWWIWLATTFFANRFRADDGVHRALILAQMVLLTMTALAIGDGVEFHEGFVSVVYGLLIADVAIMYGRTARGAGIGAVKEPDAALRRFAAQRRNEYAVAVVPMVVATLVGGPGRYVCWSIAVLVIVLPALGYRFGRRAGEVGIDERHLVERLGLLTIIVCGESFVKVSLLAADGSLDGLDLEVLVALFLLVFAMWWAYFDDIPRSGLPGSTGRMRGWLLGHLLLQTFLVGIAVGFAKLLPLNHGVTVDGDRLLLGDGPVVGAYLALALLGVCTRRVPHRPLLLLRLGSALVVALLGVAIWRIGLGVEVTSAALAIAALVHAALADRLRRRTHIEPASSPPVGP
jgi:low temperature requirement protein LtrA